MVEELNRSSQLNRASSTLSGGSYENLELLKQRKADFALFQSGADEKKDLKEEHKQIVFVSNVFPEVAHMLVRSDIGEPQIANLSFSRIAVGVPSSGDYRVGMALLSHYNLKKPGVTILPMTYTEMGEAFRNSEVEMAIINVGLGADIVQSLIEDVNCQLVDLPMHDAFLTKHVAYSSYTIPEGTYYAGKNRIPARELKTVAVNAQLLTREDVPSKTVREVLQTMNHAKFLKGNRLRDLFIDGNRYAVRQPEFPLHQGAARYYDPSFRPLINPDFVEATEGIRSFFVSGLIGLFLLVRWLRKKSERSQAHKLDEFIHRLLGIEQEQMELDSNYSEEDIARLERYLDEITDLRRHAMTEFTAHELHDDPAIECFIVMSHALSEKINSKLTRDAIRKSGKAHLPS